MSAGPDILFEKRGTLGLITLNRPGALNALNENMCLHMMRQLELWAHSEHVRVVAIRGAGEKAFCAGGDIRALYQGGQAGSSGVMRFYWHEYQLNTMIKEYPKPFVAFIDGIVMGGGVGVSVHGSQRIAGDRTLFAMPETGIGLIPDVGGTYFLPRLRGGLGNFLGLTGARLKAADCVYAGIATHYVPSQHHSDLLHDLSASGDGNDIGARYSVHREPAPLATLQQKIDRFFAGASVEDILTGLGAADEPWAQEMAKSLRSKSPTSLKLTFRQLRCGVTLSFRECMALEYRIISRIMQAHDFFEGVRAIVIDKDNAPHWKPARLEDVSDASVEAYFASLGSDEWHYDRQSAGREERHG